MKVKVSVIIPAWEEKNILPITFKYLKELNLPFKFSELIVVAGGNDNTFKICKNYIKNFSNFSKSILLNQTSGDYKSGALKKGMRRSLGDYVILIDADTLVPSDLIIKAVKYLKRFDALNCDYIPILKRGSFWYDYHIVNKILWASNEKSLSSLFGGATISIDKNVITEIGIENFFTQKSTAGIDYYISLVLKKYNKKIGLIRGTKVATPRPNNFKDFFRDRKRWLKAFFQIHWEDKLLIYTTLLISLFYLLFSPILLIHLFLKILRSRSFQDVSKSIKYTFILFLVEYILNFLKIKIFIEESKKSEFIGHFKGSRYLKNHIVF